MQRGPIDLRVIQKRERERDSVLPKGASWLSDKVGVLHGPNSRVKPEA